MFGRQFTSLVLLAALVATTVPLRAETALVVAVPAPTTGTRAPIGLAVHTAAELVAAEINAAGGVLGQPLQLRLVDDPCTRAGAQPVDAAATVIGHPCAASAAAVGPAYAAAGRLFIAAGVAHWPSGARPAIGMRLPVPDQDEMAALAAAIAASAGDQARIAIVGDRTRQSTATSNRLAAVLAALGRAPVRRDGIEGGQRAFPLLASQLATAGVTHVALTGFPVEAAALAEDIRQAIPGVVLFGTELLAVDDFARLAGTATEGVRLTRLETPATMARSSVAVRQLIARLEGVGIAPTREALYTAAALQAYATAVKRSRTTDPTAVTAALKEPVETLLGPIAFDQSGDARRAVWVMHTWRGGRLVADD